MAKLICDVLRVYSCMCCRSFSIYDELNVSICLVRFFFVKQKTAYEMRISDWSSDVCSSDLAVARAARQPRNAQKRRPAGIRTGIVPVVQGQEIGRASCRERVCQYV